MKQTHPDILQVMCLYVSVYIYEVTGSTHGKSLFNRVNNYLCTESVNVLDGCDLWMSTCLENIKSNDKNVEQIINLFVKRYNKYNTSMAYCSAGKPNASHPIGCRTLKPCIRLNLARMSVAVYPRGWPTCKPAPLQQRCIRN